MPRGKSRALVRPGIPSGITARNAIHAVYLTAYCPGSRYDRIMRRLVERMPDDAEAVAMVREWDRLQTRFARESESLHLRKVPRYVRRMNELAWLATLHGRSLAAAMVAWAAPVAVPVSGDHLPDFSNPANLPQIPQKV